VLRRERAFTSFSRSFTLPDNVHEDGIKASLHQGVLRLTVPKVWAAGARAIAVGGGALRRGE
jgi:HSP20 family protein